MLTLTRKVGETIMIGDDIIVTITRMDRASIRLRIEAPKEVVILRGELQEDILRNGRRDKAR